MDLGEERGSIGRHEAHGPPSRQHGRDGIPQKGYPAKPECQHHVDPAVPVGESQFYGQADQLLVPVLLFGMASLETTDPENVAFDAGRRVLLSRELLHVMVPNDNTNG